MTPEVTAAPGARSTALRWQSQAVLLATVPVVGTWVTLSVGQDWQLHDPVLWHVAIISIGFGALAYSLRAASLGAAFTGVLFTAALYLQTPGWRTSLWPVLALFLLTHAATRFGRRRKESLGIAEGKRGRRASQVAANLGVAVLAGTPLTAWQFWSTLGIESTALVASIAAIAEAAADTVSSEIGQVLGGEPRMITTFRRVPVGTDGGITLMGTLVGSLAAAVVVVVAVLVLPLPLREALIALGAAVFGLLFDSLLGAIPERRGWLNNDAVNALSTLAAALVATAALRFF